MGQTQYKEYRYASGNIYKGGWRNGKRHGEGTYIWTDGTTYKGFWKDNMQNGLGEMTFPNGNIFNGEFKHNNPDGSGTLTTKNNERIAGQWTFTGRTFPTGSQDYAVGTYFIHVNVTNLTTGSSVDYRGHASLHLLTGLLVLPGMPPPPEASYVDGNYMQVTPFVVAEAVEPLGQPTPPACAATPVEHNSFSLEEPLVKEEYPDAVLDNGQPAVAYGVQDRALNVKPAVNPHPVPYKPYDPRNYF